MLWAILMPVYNSKSPTPCMQMSVFGGLSSHCSLAAATS